MIGVFAALAAFAIDQITNPLCKETGISVERIAQENIIGREPGSGTRQAVEKLCQKDGVDLVAHMEFDDTEAIKQGVISGLSVAYLSLHSLRLELKTGELKVLDVQGFPLRRRWFALNRKGKHLTSAAQTFLTYLQQVNSDPIA
jgi:DNA-binding transcriptional LysR family regulator